MAAPAKTVLITGAARGLGQEIAFRLAADGFNVALNDINLQELQKTWDILSAKAHNVIMVPGDVSVDADVQQIITQTVAEFGHLDVMIANAGIPLIKPIVDTTVEDADRVFAVNIRGVFLCYKYAAKQMIDQGHGGKLLSTSSILGNRAFPLLPAYSASKFAIRGLTESAALELGKYGITVNCFAPGNLDTPLAREEAKVFGGFDVIEAVHSKMTPLGRLGTIEDVASVISFLSSPAANWITGQTITIDGGRGLTGPGID